MVEEEKKKAMIEEEKEKAIVEEEEEKAMVEEEGSAIAEEKGNAMAEEEEVLRQASRTMITCNISRTMITCNISRTMPYQLQSPNFPCKLSLRAGSGSPTASWTLSIVKLVSTQRFDERLAIREQNKVRNLLQISAAGCEPHRSTENPCFSL